MNIKTKETYSELYQILNFLGDEYISKLPKSLYNMLKEKRNINYNPEYTDDIPLNKQNIKRETISILALLHFNYWCENEQEKLELKQILKNNEDRYQEELREKYNPDNLFKKRYKEKDTEEDKNKCAIIEYKETTLKRLINKIKYIFHIN